MRVLYRGRSAGTVQLVVRSPRAKGASGKAKSGRAATGKGKSGTDRAARDRLPGRPATDRQITTSPSSSSRKQAS